MWCIGDLDAICHVRGSVDFTLLPYAMVTRRSSLINETLVFVKNILFEKCTRFYGAFAPNPGMFWTGILARQIRTVRYHQNMLFPSQRATF